MEIAISAAWISAAIGLSAFGITVAQFVLAQKKQRLDNTWSLINRLNDRGDQEDRFYALELLEKANQLPNKFKELDHKEMALLSRVAGTLTLIGYLGKQNKVNLKMLLKMYGYSIHNYAHKLQPYRDYRQSLDGYPIDNAWSDLDWIASIAKEFCKEGRKAKSGKRLWRPSWRPKVRGGYPSSPYGPSQP